MIELLYLASQIQCGAGGAALTIQVDVFHEQELVKTMMVNDRVFVPVESVNDLAFEYSIVNNTPECSALATPSTLVLAPDGQLPTVAGFDQQDSVVSILNGLNQYQELFLVELGVTDTESTAYDLQDVIFKVDNNPTISDSPEPPVVSIVYPD